MLLSILLPTFLFFLLIKLNKTKTIEINIVANIATRN